jgi:hypothetical protein
LFGCGGAPDVIADTDDTERKVAVSQYALNGGLINYISEQEPRADGEAYIVQIIIKSADPLNRHYIIDRVWSDGEIDTTEMVGGIFSIQKITLR